MSTLAYKITVAPPVWVVSNLLITPASYILYYVTLPARAVVGFVLSILSFFVDLIRHYESFLIFVGTAILIGAIVGGALHLLSRGIAGFIGAGTSSKVDEDDVAVRTIADYRAAREKRKLENEQAAQSIPSLWSLSHSDEQGFNNQTIMEEEEDSDF